MGKRKHNRKAETGEGAHEEVLSKEENHANDRNDDGPLDEIAGFKVIPLTMPPLEVELNPRLSMAPIPLFTTPSPSAQPTPVTQLTPAPTKIIPTHYMYFKQHTVKTSKKKNSNETEDEDPLLPEGRTLFVVNIPVDTTQMHLQRIFRRCGTICRVVLHDRVTIGGDPLEQDESVQKGKAGRVVKAPEIVDRSSGHPVSNPGGSGCDASAGFRLRDLVRSGSNAHVVFVEEDAVERALIMRKRRRVWSDRKINTEDDAPEPNSDKVRKEESPLLEGFELWISEYIAARPPLSQLQTKVDSYIQSFEEAEAKRRAEVLAIRNVPDEDGFVTVVRRGRRNTNRDGQGAVVKAARAVGLKRSLMGEDDDEEAKKRKRRKQQELVNFYRFQLRETKRNDLAELRRKFEEDKKRIAALRANRKFKPY
ncbi:ribosomal RNA-processing protein 7-domain-containing protein [Cladochytrium replicatum]|nr:ribosomal RNA-processing protein 7-domain-containing protein [Cladochytrium replicatum]